LYQSPAGLEIDSPRFVGSTEQVAFVERRSYTTAVSAGMASVAVVDLSGRKQTLSEGWGDLIGLAWNQRSREIWFTAREAGGSSGGLAVHAVDLSGRQRVVQRTPGVLRLEDIAADGRVLLTHLDWPLNVTCLPPGETRERDLTWLDFSSGTDLSDDGKMLLISEGGLASGAKGAVYLRKTDGSPAVRLSDGLAFALSRDEKWVITASAETPDRLVLVPTGAGESQTLASPGFRYEDAEFFPDGKSVALKARVGAEAGLYVQEREGGKPRLLATNVLDLGPISPDGKRVAASTRDGTFLYPADGGSPQTLPLVSPRDRSIRWDSTGRDLFVAKDGVPSEVYRLDATTGRHASWRKLGPSDTSGIISIHSIVLTPDARSYCYTYLRDLGSLFVVTELR
jgi:hypothetical protein